MDLEWTDGLCADLVEVAQEAAVQGGTVRPGSVVRVLSGPLAEEVRALAGQNVTVREIAVGSKGKGPFRKRLWVAFRVEDGAGTDHRLLATELQVEG